MCTNSHDESDKVLIGVLRKISHKIEPYFRHHDATAVLNTQERPISQPPQEVTNAAMQAREETKAALEQHPLFRETKNFFFGAKQMMLDPAWQAWNLLKVAHEHHSDEGAVAWLRKVYSTSVTGLKYVVQVHGLKLKQDQNITLSNGIQLIPLSGISPSRYSDGLFSAYTSVERHMNIPAIPQPIHAPILAIKEVSQVHRTDAKKDEVANLHYMELERTVRAFVLADDASPIIGAGWIEFMDYDLAAAEVGKTGMLPAIESDPNAILPLDIDDKAIQWVERYLTLQEDVRNGCNIDVANERLALARRRRHAGNKAIEGAICLEALLGDKQKEELTYRLKLRAALLLATSVEERKKISKMVKEFYKLRSNTVHGNVVKHDINQHNCAEAGLKICTDTLRGIVSYGQKCNWEDWELSGGKPHNGT